MVKKNNYALTFILLSCLVIACDSRRVYEENYTFEGNDWYVDSVLNYPFTIKDTLQPLAILLNVRNSVSYPYTNLYIKYYLINPQGQEDTAVLYNMILFDEKTGKPFGDGLGDIFDHQFTLMPHHRFERLGTYTLRIKQYMRKDPLPFIMALGVRLETID